MDEKGTILIIDDEPDILRVLVKRLEDADYRVEAFESALEGFAKVKDIMPSLIILDVLMPELNGMQLKEKLSEDETVADIPVIFLTAKNTVPTKVLGFRLGADDFVTKPFVIEELLARISSAIGRRAYYEKIAVTDPLTGLSNTYVFKKEFGLFSRMARRYQRTFSLVLIDVDGLKGINDKHGHAVGDLVLKTVASTMLRVFRTSDILVRYGGDEFAVIMPETDQDQASCVITRLREEIKKTSLELQEGLKISISVSVGCSAYSTEMASEEELFNQTDKALYKDKMAGKEKKRDKKIVLIIEDEKDLSKTLAFRLRQAGFNTEIAEDGEEGLKKARQIHPDLIILDLMLPLLPGEEVCKAVHEDLDKKLASTPIIMLTAKGTDADRVVGKVIGADYYMTKPYNLPDLLQNIKQAIGVS